MELPAATIVTLHAKYVRRAVIDYIARYNLERRHSSIGYLIPVDYEEAARMSRAAYGNHGVHEQPGKPNLSQSSTANE